MSGRAFTFVMAVLLVSSWTGDLAGTFPSASEAQAKANGGQGKGAGRGGSRGAGKNARGRADSGKGGANKEQGNSSRGSAGQGKGSSSSPKGKNAAAQAANGKASPKAHAAAAKASRPGAAQKNAPSSAQRWASHIRELEPRGQTPNRNARREIVVSTRDPSALSGLAATGIKPVALKQMSGVTLFKLELPQGLSPAAALRVIAEREPHAIASANDLYYPAEHADCPTCEHKAVPSPALASACTTMVTIGLIDTQVDLSHRALRDRNVRLVKSREGAGSSTAHGTSVAALLVGKAPDGTAGLLPGATLLATDAFSTDANGDFTDAFALAAALDTLVDAGAQVINLSLAGPSNEVLETAVANAVAKGVDVVASVGNISGADQAYPAAYSGVISATAVDAQNDIYRYANRGPYVDFAAPGVAVSIPGSDLVSVSGTSFATPFVTAAAAVLRGMNPERGTPIDEVLKQAVIDLGEPGRDDVFGWGVIDMASVCPAETPLANTSPKKPASPE